MRALSSINEPGGVGNRTAGRCVTSAISFQLVHVKLSFSAEIFHNHLALKG